MEGKAMGFGRRCCVGLQAALLFGNIAAATDKQGAEITVLVNIRAGNIASGCE
jgi:hypothetical protein